MSVLIRNVTAVDPSQKLNAKVDILIERGKIAKIANGLNVEAKQIIDGEGLHAVPGFVDIHVHFREPGFEYKETLDTGVRAALHGGFVAVVTMPNTKPACDNQSIVAHILRRAKDLGFNIFPCGTISKGRRGEKLAEMAELKEAGCVAVSDDGSFVQNALLMRHALSYASMYDLIVMSHAIDGHLTQDAVMNEGIMSTTLGLKGEPSAAEDIAVARDIQLAKLTGARLHIAHVSTKGAVELVRAAKKEGWEVTAEAAPHHFSITDRALEGYDSNFKMNPPLRSDPDVEAIIKGLQDGTIDCIATDHAPHAEEEKERELAYAPVGVIGLETSFGVTMTELFHKKLLSFEDVIKCMSLRPLELIRKEGLNQIREGQLANIAIVSQDEEWVVRKEDFHSKSKNSCFIGRKLKGRVRYTICNGKVYDYADASKSDHAAVTSKTVF